ncbi:MAG: hypothetical protein LBS21_10790 [Clostridiales bacterium]|jgi:hypothetical protein|nr:hypothetical protein [Clostridiales bacterium]
MKKVRKILLYTIAVIATYGLSFRVNQYQRSYNAAMDKAEDCANVLYMNISDFRQIIPYYILSPKYQRSVTKDEYNNAKTEEQWYSIFLKMDSVKRSKNASTANEMSTTMHDNSPCGYMSYNGKMYWVTLEIDFKSNLLTLKTEVSRFAMISKEVTGGLSA